MEVDAWVKQKKELYRAVLSFLESENDSEDEFRSLTKIIDDQEIIQNKKTTREIFQLLYEIGDNHHRTVDFFNRFSRIIKYLTKNRLPINNTEILDIYKKNKRLLLLLFEQKGINPDESLLKYLMKSRNSNGQKLYYYLFSEIKDFIGKRKRKRIEYMIQKKFNESIKTFESKIKEGENNSPICKMIRQDSIQEFVSYVNQTNLTLTSTIKADIYESNSFLIENEPSLIEYALFYGSIQVIKYLQNNHVEFPPKSWLYAIHSNNPEMIELLEENKISINDESVKESIKCHHNDITAYILDNLVDKSYLYITYEVLAESASQFCNYYYFPDDVISMISEPEKETFKMHYLTSSFTSFTIPSSITSIGNYAVSWCTSLTQISIPSSVTKIGEYAMNGCASLTQITIPSSVTEIEGHAFSGCSSLTRISIPSSVTLIGDHAFAFCSSLIQISIPSSVTLIGDHAFAFCSSLIQISIPSSVTSIEECAFFDCKSLRQISIPSSITSIEKQVFWWCGSLIKITFEIPCSITSINDSAFVGCYSLTEISIPSSVTSIGGYAFENCSSLKQISFDNPCSVTSIYGSAFARCSSLTQITIPSSVTSIGDYTFEDCSSLTQISFEIPSSVTSIGDSAFSNCESLTQVSIPSSVTSIGNNLFYNCPSLTQVSIPSSVTSIGNNLFYNCPKLTQVLRK